MNYKIYVNTEIYLAACCNEFDDYDEAKDKMEDMVAEMLKNATLKDVYDRWLELIDELPSEVASILMSFKNLGLANSSFTGEGYTQNCHYAVTENEFKLFDSSDDTTGLSYCVETNMLNCSGEEEDYDFKVWVNLGGVHENLTISLACDDESDYDEDDEDDEISGDVEVFNVVPDDVRASFLEDND